MLSALSNVNLFNIRLDFWFIFVLIPLILLILFAVLKPRFTPLVILISPVIDIFSFWLEFNHYEGRPFMILFVCIQLLFVIPISLVIRAKARK